ncbi:hypothetical protein D3C75_1181680 [compost metagenome]
MISPLPITWRTSPGSGQVQLACTTQPTTRSNGMGRAMAPAGSTLASGASKPGSP